MNEPRVLVIAQTTWTATVTHRDEDTIPLISVRRARPNEEARYHEESREDRAADSVGGASELVNPKATDTSKRVVDHLSIAIAQL
jgi:hypothetical protein